MTTAAMQLPVSTPIPTGAMASPPNEFEALARAAIAGDAEAFGRLVERHERAALAVAYGICGDAAKAGDAVQDACLLAWRKRRTLAEPERFSGWLFNIVRRCAVDQVRRNRLRLPPLEMTSPPVEPVDVTIERREADERVRQALAELDEDSRVAVAMRYYDDQPSRRIADVLGCTPAAVDMRLKRARDALRNRLAGWWKGED